MSFTAIVNTRIFQNDLHRGPVESAQDIDRNVGHMLISILSTHVGGNFAANMLCTLITGILFTRANFSASIAAPREHPPCRRWA